MVLLSEITVTSNRFEESINKTTLKLGATNLLNEYYAQGYGLAQIGGMYYLTLRFN